MTPPRTDLTITLEEELPFPDGAPRRLRLSSTLHAAEGKEVGADEIADAVRALDLQMRRAREAAGMPAPGAPAPRADRPVDDLMEAYRPKSAALLDALLWEGELTPTEHQALREALAGKAPGRPPAPAPAPSRRPTSVAAPVPAPATTPAPGTTPTARGTGPQGPPRSVEALLRELHLKDLKEANRARYERVISFDEWSALKAHFERKG